MNEMERFITHSTKEKIIIVAVGLVFIGLGVVLFLQHSPIMSVVFVVLGVLAALGGLTSDANARKHLQELEDSGLYNRAKADFAKAQTVADGKLKLGEEFIFRKNMPEIIRYRDIQHISYAEKSTSNENGGSSWEGSLYVKPEKGGLEQPLCTVYGNMEEQALEICHIITSINPDIETIGFR